ncbi:MAG: VOC family protein, partial [Bacteroidota bacterium]|nr:VOC family protein [Bacteroidota bacterium]
EGVLLLSASDDIMGNTKGGSQITLSINCNSENELNETFSKLSEGGNVFHPVKKEFWGALFGQFTDQFGITWMLSYDENGAS